MAIIVTHSKVSTIPDDADTSLVRPSDWNADHTLVGLGTMAEQNANNVNITGGSITGVTGVGDVVGPASSTDNAVARFDSTTGKLLQNSVVTVGDTGAVAGVTTLAASTSVTTPIVQATNSAGLALKNSGGTTQISMGAGGGDNVTVAVSTNLNGTNAQIDISPTGTGHVHIKPTGVNSVEIIPVSVGKMDNVAIGATTASTGKFTTLEATGNTDLGTGSANYIDVSGGAAGIAPVISAQGSDGNIPLVLQPKGTGALQAQLTTSTTAGGNARGANAVDWQTTRATAAQIASGQYAFIGGGQNNTASQFAAAVVGGRGNNGGNTNYGFIGAGLSNGLNVGGSGNSYAAVVGGNANTAAGYYNFVGMGFTNSGTSATAVTTQTTTIATTAGTTLYLSSANASIRVGAYIAGTGVASDTYATSTVTTGTPAVMNTSSISGTTLTVGTLASGTIIAGQVLTGTGVTAGTYIVSGSASTWTVSVSQTVASTTITGTARTITISQNATTAAGITLSFFTPHGVVVGGGNNQATGAYSFIGGGGNAGVAGERNVASGDWSFVGGGTKNTASGIGAVICGGGTDTTIQGNTAGGNGSFVGAGIQNSASGLNSMVVGGRGNTASGNYSSVYGGGWATTRNITGNTVTAGSNTPLNTFVTGQSQTAILVLARQTTDATATALTSDTGVASGINQVILPNNSAYYFRGSVIAGVTGAGDSKAWTFEGAIKRGVGVGTTVIIGTVILNTIAQDAGASTWSIAITADTTNGGVRVTVTGQASTTIRWVCKIETTEMTY
jgi:hypothetical protein